MPTLLVLLLFVGIGCGEPAPGVEIEDPGAYIRTQLIATLETPKTGAPTHVIDDPVYLDSVVGAVLARSLSADSLPSDSRQLDRIVRSGALIYRGNLLDTPKRRATVETLIRERFEASPVELRGKTAVTDLGHTPGRFERGMRTGWDISESPEVSSGILTPWAVAETLSRMQHAQPSAYAFLFEVKVPYGTSTQRVRYFYAPAEDHLRMLKGAGEEYASTHPIGGIEGLRAHETPRHPLDMFDRICASDGDPGCPNVWNP